MRLKTIFVFVIVALIPVLGFAYTKPASLAVSWADDFTPGRETWVDVSYDYSGLDTGDTTLFYLGTYVGDGSETHPYLNINQAVTDVNGAITPGTRVNVKSGTYTTDNIVYSSYEGDYNGIRESAGTSINCRGFGGTIANPVMLYSYDGSGMAIIDGENQADSVGLNLRFTIADYIIIDGFEIKNCMQNISIGGVSPYNIGTMIRNCIIHDAYGGDCIKVNQMDNVYIENNKVYNPGLREDETYQEPIDFVAVNGGHIILNEIYGVAPGGCDWGIYAKGGSRDIVFYGNYVHDCAVCGISLGGYTSYGYFYNSNNDSGDDKYECYNCEAHNNVIANIGLAGFECIGCIDSTAEYNTLYNCGLENDEPVKVRPGFTSEYWYVQGGDLRFSSPDNFTFKNNIIADSTGRNLYYIKNHLDTGVQADPAEIHVSSNLWWTDGVTMADGDLGSHIEVSGDVGSVYNTDPQFIGSSMPLELSSTSPAISKGVANSEIPIDFYGRFRPSGSGWDLGAFEYVIGVIITNEITIYNTTTILTE
jgi:hypothetical protein